MIQLLLETMWIVAVTVAPVFGAEPQTAEIVRQSDTVLILGLATTIATIVTAIVAAFTTYYVARLNNKATVAAEADKIVAAKAAEAADKAEEVRKSLQVNRVSTDDKLHEIKTLVNGGVEKSLRIAAVALRRVAATTNNAGDIEAARVAEEALAEHVAAQVKVDKAHAKMLASPEVRQHPSHSKNSTMGIGEAVGEIGTDVKVVMQDVKDVKAEVKAEVKDEVKKELREEAPPPSKPSQPRRKK